MMGVAAVSLIVFLASVVGLVSDSHRNSTIVTLDLASPCSATGRNRPGAIGRFFQT